MKTITLKDLAFFIKLEQKIQDLNKNTNFLKFWGMSMKENKSRSVGKSISWRILASCDTILISYLITGSIAIAASIGSIEVLTKMFLYYFHERVWDRVAYGKY